MPVTLQTSLGVVSFFACAGVLTLTLRVSGLVSVVVLILQK
jgi:hypothetical protein